MTFNGNLGDGPLHVVDFDYYGFAIFDKDYKPDGERCHKYSRLNEDKQLLAQWRRVMLQPDWKSMHGCPSVKIQKLLRQGVPAVVRPDVWTKLLDADTLRASSAFKYKAQLCVVREQLVDVGVSEYGGPDAVSFLWELEANGVEQVTEGHITLDCLRQILLDLDRSYPTHRMFIKGRTEGLEGRAALFRILALYACYNKQVGYCQGMSYLGGLLLMVMGDEESAFWGLVSLLERYKYLRGYYDKHMERIQRHVKVFQKLIKQRLPHIDSHLEEHGVSAMMFTTPWFLAVYTSLPCWETVLSVWDLFILDGAVTIFRVGLGILEVMADLIMSSSDISTLLPQLLHLPDERVDFLHLMPPVFDVYLEYWEVAQLEAIVIEEACVSARRTCPAQPQCSKSDTTVQLQGKRRRTESDSAPQVTSNSTPPSSLFQRFVNIFTPTEQRTLSRRTPARTPTRVKRLMDESTPGVITRARSLPRRPLHSKQSLTSVRSHYGQVYVVSPDQSSGRRSGRPHIATTPSRKMFRRRNTVGKDENLSPSRPAVRRSPRLRQAALRRLIGMSAEVQLSFKDFRASKPLRNSQRCKSSGLSPLCTNNASPLELRTLYKAQ